MPDVLELDGVTCRYPGAPTAAPALADVSLTVPAGTFVAVAGPTGSGKSTLLSCAAGLERVSTGRVRLLGHDLTRLGERASSRLRRDDVGVVFQAYDLLSELTVGQNVLLPCRLGAARRRDLGEVLASVGLAGLEARPVGSLSGGQRQRVAVARALVTEPRVVFADEPTGALDPVTGHQVLDLLRRAVDRRGLTVVMVTHDPAAAALSDRLVLLRAGRVVDDRPTPAPAEVARLLRGGAVSMAAR